MVDCLSLMPVFVDLVVEPVPLMKDVVPVVGEWQESQKINGPGLLRGYQSLWQAQLYLQLQFEVVRVDLQCFLHVIVAQCLLKLSPYCPSFFFNNMNINLYILFIIILLIKEIDLFFYYCLCYMLKFRTFQENLFIETKDLDKIRLNKNMVSQVSHTLHMLDYQFIPPWREMLGDSEDFRKRREQHTVQIRRNCRQHTIQKHRTATSTPHFPAESSDNILDERYRPQLQEMTSADYTSSMFEELMELMLSSDPLEMHRGMIGVRKLLANENQSLMQAFFGAGLLSRVFEFIRQQQFPQLKFEASWTLTNFTAGDTKYCARLVEQGAIEHIVALLREGNQRMIISQAIWAAGNLAADQAAYRDILLKSGAMNALVLIAENTQNKALLKNSVWAISNMCLGSPLPDFELISSAVQPLARAIISKSIPQKDIVVDCFQSLAYLCQGSEQLRRRLLNTGILSLIFDYTASPVFRTSSIKIIQQISGGDDNCIQILLNQGILRLITELMQQPNNIKKEICQIASNIVVKGNEDHAFKLISEQELLECFVQGLETEVLEVKRAILHFFANMAQLRFSKEVLSIYARLDILRYLLDLIKSECIQVIEQALDFLKLILALEKATFANGDDCLFEQLKQLNSHEILQNLEHYPSVKVSQRAINLLTEIQEISDSRETQMKQ